MIEAWVALSRTDQIATSALGVSILALVIAAVAARYSRAQALVAMRSDMRVQVEEIDEALANAEALRNVLAGDSATVRASMASYFAKGHLPSHQRPPPPYPTSVGRMARKYLGQNEFATVALTASEREFLEALVAVDDAILAALTEIYRGTLAGDLEDEEDALVAGIEKLLAELGSFDSQIKTMLGRTRNVLRHRRERLQKRLR